MMARDILTMTRRPKLKQLANAIISAQEGGIARMA